MGEIVRDGVQLWYTESGSGDPPFVFVHGWCCDHTYFQPQFDHFKPTNRVAAVDLRGHGRSDKPEQDYTIECFADDTAAIARELGLRDAVVVGHSMGGVTALQAAASHPDVFAAAVMIDPAPVYKAPGTDELIRPVLDQMRGPDYKEVSRNVVSTMFLPTDDPDLKARVMDGMSGAPQHVMVSAIEGIFFGWDGPAAAAACKVPVLNISAGTPTGDALEQFKAACPTLVTGQTVGTGHFNQLLVPDQVNAMIERFLVTSVLPAKQPV